MEYPIEYLYAKDIDWFCDINGRYVHVASAGGILPKSINDRDKLRDIQKIVFELPDIYTDDQLIINRQLGKQFSNEIDRNNYMRSFMAMARKGFISMDRTNFEDIDDDTYHIVCMPPEYDQLPVINEISEFRIDNPHLFDYPQGGIKLLSLID